MEGIVSRLSGSNFFVVHLALIIEFFNHNTLVQNGCPPAHVEEGIGLFSGNDFMKPATVLYLDIVVVFLPDLDDEIVRFLVFEAYKIQLIRISLAGVPYLIQIRVNAHLPAQDDSIKVQFVYAFLDKYGPLQEVGADIDTCLLYTSPSPRD